MVMGVGARMGVGIGVGFHGVIASVGGRRIGFYGRGSGRVGEIAVNGDLCG